VVFVRGQGCPSLGTRRSSSAPHMNSNLIPQLPFHLRFLSTVKAAFTSYTFTHFSIAFDSFSVKNGSSTLVKYPAWHHDVLRQNQAKANLTGSLSKAEPYQQRQQEQTLPSSDEPQSCSSPSLHVSGCSPNQSPASSSKSISISTSRQPCVASQSRRPTITTELWRLRLRLEGEILHEPTGSTHKACTTRQ